MIPAETIVIAGPTGAGKTELSLLLAEYLGGEIVGADAFQIYAGLPILTAQPTAGQRGRLPHHLVGSVDPSESYDAARYRREALAALLEISARGKRPIVVGGTGLYIKAILDDLNFPDTDPEVRAKLEAQSLEFGSASLFERLKELDPAAALAIDQANTRRIIRALEVIEITGQPFTANLPREGSLRYPDALQFGLVMDRDHLRERIDLRVDRMWERGFVAEVDQLITQGIKEGSTAQRALGYAQIISMRNGAISEDEAKEDTKRASRQYARRQETWFSRDVRIQWVAQRQPRLETILQKINS